jgi:hypothetical protein
MPFNNDIVSPFGKKLDSMFNLGDVKRHLTFDEMQSLSDSGQIGTETPISRKLKNGLVYQLNIDGKMWDLFNVPEQQGVNKNGQK